MSLLSGMKRLASSFGLGKKQKNPGKNNLAPVDIVKCPELDPAAADLYFTDLEPPVPLKVWLKLDQKDLSGWQIRDARNILSIDGPLRVRVKSVVMKAVQLGPHITEYGHGPVHEWIKKLAEEDPTQALWGPEYELELLDHDNLVVRYFVCSPEKEALSGVLWVRRETILGFKVDKLRSNGQMKRYLVPVAWEPV
jgi:hypothetical protein